VRSLKLSKETLTELTTGDLAGVVGGASGASCAPACPQSDFMECLTGLRCVTTNTLLCP
jgi:hypothetical protein